MTATISNSRTPSALPITSTHIVATLFYRTDTPSHARPHPDASPRPVRPRSPLDTSLPSITLDGLTDGTVPTENISEYPLEPPTPGPDPLDHLYGSYISQSCLTDFSLTLVSIIPELQGLETEIRPKALEQGKFPQVVEVSFPLPASSSITLEVLRRHEAVSRFEREWNTEAVFQANSVYRRHKRLAFFDMDSTLIAQEVIDEIADIADLKPQVAAITAAAMNGELDFEASLRKRCALLKGLPADVFEKVKPRISINEGVEDLIVCLKRLGFRIGVLSGGFLPLTGWLAHRLGLDWCKANTLTVDPATNTLTGGLEGYIVDANMKRQTVLEVSAQEDVKLEQVLCIGDGANDLPMLGVAGLGVAFHAKPRVQMQAPARLNRRNMRDVLYLIGITKEEQEELLR